VYQSDSVIVSLGGTMVLKGYFKGNWVVMIVGVGHGTDSPPGFADLLASFSFV
jgi:hypothetical protein